MILNSPYISGSLTVTGNITACGGVTISGSIASASYAVNASYLNNSGSGEFVPTGSFNTASGSFSTRISAIEGKYITTGSNTFIGNQTITGSILQSGSLSVNGCIVSTGQIVAQTINVQQVTSSIVYSCGSNIFGCAVTDTQQMTGSVRITGSFNSVGVGCFSAAVCAPTFIGTTNINTGTSCVVDSHMLNVNGDQASLNVGLVLRNTNATYPKVYGLTNVNNNLNLYDYTANSQRLRIDTNGIACFACQKCAPGMDIMPSGIGVSTLGGIMRVVTTGTSTGIAVGQSNANRYTHFAANDIQVFNDDFFLTTRCAFPLSIGTCYTARLTFAATGIACFSCTVCAPRLEILRSGANNGLFVYSNAGATAIGCTMAQINGLTNDSTGNILTLGSLNDGIRAVFRNDGNVGIGVSSPGAPLHICWGSSANVNPTLIVEGAVANNDNYPRVRFKGGTYPDADSKFPQLYITNGGLGLYFNGGYSTTYNNPTSLGLNNGTITLETGNAGSLNTRLAIGNTGIAVFTCQVCATQFVASNINLTGNYNNSYTICSSGWSNQYVTIIPPNTLGTRNTYVVSVYSDNNGAGAPYVAGASFLFTPGNTNGGGIDNEFQPLTSMHQGYGGGYSLWVAARAGSGQVSAGLAIKLCNWATVSGTLSVKASLLQPV